MSSDTVQPQHRSKGRAALTNPDNRFDRLTAEAVDDGWARDHEELPVLRTQVTDEVPRKVITRNTSPDLSFDRSINPYRGCEHGCIYCFARPSHAYLGLSPGLDFETQLIARPQAAERLREELSRKAYKPATIAIGSNTDPYQPIERDRGIMREILQVLAEFNHPVAIVTKGTLISRDIDVLAPMAAKGLLRVGISVTTLDKATSRAMEPRVPLPAARLRASSIVLRLPREVAGLFRDWLEAAFPDRAARVMARVRELHGGKDYDPAFGTRMVGQGEWAALMQQRFKLACKRLGLDRRLPDLRSDLFAVPPKAGDQMDLFG